MKFAVFGPDGEAVRIGTCPATSLTMQAGEGETAFDWTGRGEVSAWHVVDGVLVEK